MTTVEKMLSKRNPDATRRRLLDAGFREVYRNGFRTSSLDTILREAGVTKGALYHHFPNKMALGYAIVEEILKGHLTEKWIDPLESSPDPLATLKRILSDFPENSPESAKHCGCPINNLVQEMSLADEGFRERLNSVLESWQDAIARALARGQESGRISRDVSPRKSAAFIVAAVEGCMGMMKNAQDMGLFETCSEGLMVYLDTLQGPRAA